MHHRTSSQQQNVSEQNSYLSRYKEDISLKQKTIRERLGIDPNEKQKSSSSIVEESSNSRALCKSSIPSIDGDNLESQSMTREQNNYQSSRSSFFNDDAEESLQFFKKNLMPKGSAQKEIKPTTVRQTQSIPKSSNYLDRPLSSSRFINQQQRHGGAPATNDEPNFDAKYQHNLTPTSSKFDKTRLYYDEDDTPIIKTRPLPIKQTSLNEPRFERARQQQPKQQSNNANETVRQAPNEPLPRRLVAVGSSRLRNQAAGPVNEYESTRQSSNTNTLLTDDDNNYKQRSSRRQLKAEINDARPDARRERETEPKELTSMTSPKTRSPEPFSRKPLYHSLFRAHDSIRLKVNRPKIRPKSEVQVDDTCIDGEDEFDDNAKTSKENELVDDDQRDSGGKDDQPNERGIDIKRWSFRRRSKTKKNKDQETEPKQPVRNFLDLRVIKIVRSAEERSIGVTVRAEDGNIVVARIMAGSLADKQGVLQVGDIILTVNNREVYTPEQLQEEIRSTINDDYVLMKIVPSFREELPTLCIYLRALFSYDPNEDTLLPCKEVGVAFNQGDILEVVNQEDPNWWQARRVESENLQTGLIPSQELEERRSAFVLPDYDLATRTSICGTRVTRKSKKKEIYNIGLNNDFDKAELQLYEEVCRTPPFERRTLVLIGPNGVGKQALKSRLLAMDPERFGSCLAHTSRLPREGEEDGLHYHFVTREKMEEDIIDGKYLEYGEYDGALYGTKLDSIREVIGQGKICVLDCSPTCLKILKTPDYLPFVAFIAAPTLDQFRYLQNDFLKGSASRGVYGTFDRALSRQSRRAKTLQDFAFDFFEDEDLQVTIEESARLLRMYENYFDIVLVNNHYDRTYEQLREAIDALSMAPQWIPISWIYGN